MDAEHKINLQLGLFSFLMILGILGNVLVIYVYSRAKNRKRFLKFERMILILAVVDLLASTINPAFYIYQIKTNYKSWHFGYAGCKVIPALGPIFSSISLGLILLMAIDRDRAVCTPFKKQFSLSTLYKAIAVTIFLSIGINVPYMYFLDVHEGGKRCLIGRKGALLYIKSLVSINIISDTCFFLIFSVTTVRVCLKLAYKTQLTYPRSREFRARETRRILKMIVSMGVCFIALIFPRDIFITTTYMSYLHPPPIKVKNYFMVNAILKVIHTSNSVVNVFLYSVFNRRFRRDALHLFMQFKYIRQLSGYTSEDSSYYSDDGASSRRFSSRKQSDMNQSKRLQVLRSISVFKTEVSSINSSIQPSLQTSPDMTKRSNGTHTPQYVANAPGTPYIGVSHLEDGEKEKVVRIATPPTVAEKRPKHETTITQTIDHLNIMEDPTPKCSISPRDLNNPIFGDVEIDHIKEDDENDDDRFDEMIMSASLINEQSPML
ncbi:visual pigment-like receptor peropsin [Clytia hemisphaerica]